MAFRTALDTAMILAAGFGRRLRPLSRVRPKPLFPVLNETMLDRWLAALERAGFRRVVINTHWLRNLMAEHLAARAGRTALEVVISPEETLLGTGGGLARAADLLRGAPFLVVNSDIFTDFNLDSLRQSHLAHPNRLATLALLEHPDKANVSIGADGQVLAFRRLSRAPGESHRLAYGGLMALSPEILSFLPAGESDIIHGLEKGLARGRLIGGVTLEKAFWRDMGSLEEYWALNRDLAGGRAHLHPGAALRARLTGFVAAGPGATAPATAAIEDSVIWPGVTIGSGCLVKRAVVARDLPAGFELVDRPWAEGEPCT